LDVLFLALALALHAPLLNLHMQSAKKAKAGHFNRTVNIDYIEQKALERKKKPVALPPDVKKLEEAVKRREAEMKAALMRRAAPRPVAVPKPQVQQNLAGPMDAGKIQMELKKQMDQKAQQIMKDKNLLL